MFKEIGRVLKPDGKIIITVPTYSGKTVLDFLAFRLKIINQPEIADHKKYYEKKDFDDLIMKTGLTLLSYQKFQLGLNSLCIVGLNNHS